MATVTPNFNWPVPTSTDLVRDGATAIEALGDSIDGSLVDLKGGTTGQVLSKTSGTDMDFTWVTTDDANAIQNSIVDAKGDLISATANDTPARLAVGANGETLVADSSTSTGLRYQVTQAAGTNKVLNSDFSIWQRGTSVAATLAAAGSGYTADRFQAYVDGTMAGTISRQTSGMDDFDYCARVQRTAGNTGLSRYYLAQPIETAQTQNLRGKTVTLSFWARKGANYSSASDALRVQIEYNTSANTNAFISPTGTVGQTTFTLTTSWQRFSLTATIGATYLSLAPQFSYAPSGTAGANDYYEISGIQLQAGSVATSFQTATGTIQGELSACQRYYYQVVTGAASSVGTGFGFGTTEIDICIPLKSTLRGIPTVVSTSGTGFYLARNSGTSININGAWIFGTNSDNNPLIYAAVTGATNGISYEVRSNSASSSIGLSAEL